MNKIQKLNKIMNGKNNNNSINDFDKKNNCINNKLIK